MAMEFFRSLGDSFDPQFTNEHGASERELTLSRLIDAPREKVFRAWTEPELLEQWFSPRPWTTPVVETDVRPGGSNYIHMGGPDANETPAIRRHAALLRQSALQAPLRTAGAGP